MQRSFSTRGRLGNSSGEGIFPGFPGYAGRNLIRLPDGSYTGDPGPFWRKTTRGRFGEVLLVQSAPAAAGDPEGELGKEAGDGEACGSQPEVMLGQEVTDEPGVAPGPEITDEAEVEDGAEAAPGAGIQPEPAQQKPLIKPLVWKAFPE
ncbi:MAG: hypothetical protein GX036_08140 [Firmicutes bacterium]|mgnify:CR=1 FL=1|nr:hypothetical protein [Bacillota bacterium]